MTPGSLFLDTASFLGKLYYDKIIAYYDRPLVFTAKHDDSEQSISLVIYEDSPDDYDVWLVCKLTAEQEKNLFDGKLSLRDAVLQSSRVHIFDEPHNGALPAFIGVIPSQLKEGSLPAKDTYLNPKDFTNIEVRHE